MACYYFGHLMYIVGNIIQLWSTNTVIIQLTTTCVDKLVYMQYSYWTHDSDIVMAYLAT